MEGVVATAGAAAGEESALSAGLMAGLAAGMGLLSPSLSRRSLARLTTGVSSTRCGLLRPAPAPPRRLLLLLRLLLRLLFLLLQLLVLALLSPLLFRLCRRFERSMACRS